MATPLSDLKAQAFALVLGVSNMSLADAEYAFYKKIVDEGGIGGGGSTNIVALGPTDPIPVGTPATALIVRTAA